MTEDILKEKDLGDVHAFIGNRPILFQQKYPPKGWNEIVFKQEKIEEIKLKPKYTVIKKFMQKIKYKIIKY